MTPRHRLLGAALVVAAALAFMADRSPASGVAEAVVRTGSPPSASRAAPRSAAGKVEVAGAEPVVLALRARDAGGDAGAALFASQDWTPPAPPAAAPAPVAPSAPPVPFTFIGKAASAGVWAVFLARADQTYVVRAHTVIDGSYRVEQIAPPLMTITYLPLNQVQQLNIGVPD